LQLSKAPAPKTGQQALSPNGPSRHDPSVPSNTQSPLQTPAAHSPEIIGGPTLIPAPREGETYRWKVQDGSAEKHVYVQIAAALYADAFDDPLRSGIATKGESVLVKLLERGSVPTRIKITSAGITEVGVDRRARPCSV
jgi:hypothetical protein